MVHLSLVQKERTGSVCRNRQLLQLELASPSLSQYSCESKPKIPSEVHSSKKADAQKSSDDLSGMQI